MVSDIIDITVHVTKDGIMLETKLIERLDTLSDVEERIDELKDIFTRHQFKCAPWTLHEDDLIRPAKSWKIAVTWYNVEIGKGLRDEKDIRERWEYLNGIL